MADSESNHSGSIEYLRIVNCDESTLAGSRCADLRLPRTSYCMLEVLNLLEIDIEDRCASLFFTRSSEAPFFKKLSSPNTMQSKHRTLIVPEQTSSDPLTFTLSPFLTSSGWLSMRKHQSTIATLFSHSRNYPACYRFVDPHNYDIDAVPRIWLPLPNVFCPPPSS